MWLERFRNDFVKELKKSKNLEVIEGLDFRNAMVKNGKAFIGDICLNCLDLFFWFGEIERSKESFHLEVLETIAKDTCVINNPESVRIGLDKFYSQLVLKKNSILVPEFYLVNEMMENLEKEVKGRQFILKPRLGSFGMGIMKIKDFQNLIDIADYALLKSHFIEEFIEYEPDGWIGINVIGGKIAYSYGKQPSTISGWKVFDRKRKGGKMLLKKPTKEQEKIALKVGKVTGLDIYGVDLIKSTDGKNYVIDVNTFPGLYPEMFQKAGINGAKLIADFIKSRLA